MSPLRKIKLIKLNEHLLCALCGGYFIEATTITECLHTFCRGCIVNYLKENTFCPVCDVQVHKTKPISGLREDKTLQDIVYKLVPNLFHNEVNRRIKFYQQHPEAVGDRMERSIKERRNFFQLGYKISLSYEYLPPAHAHAHALGLRPLRAPSYGLSEPPECLLGDKIKDDKENVGESKKDQKETEKEQVPVRRYLKCPVDCQIGHLEKFIRVKYDLTSNHRVDIVHCGDCLSPELTLLDVVYMYKWTEDNPLRLQYTVISPPMPKIKRVRTVKKLKCLSSDSRKKLKKEDNSTEIKPIKQEDNSMEIKPIKQEDNSMETEPISIDTNKSSTSKMDCDNIREAVAKVRNKFNSASDEYSSLNSSRDDADDAMVIDETSQNCENFSDKKPESPTNPMCSDLETISTTCIAFSDNSIESLKSLVNQSDFTKYPNHSQSSLGLYSKIDQIPASINSTNFSLPNPPVGVSRSFPPTYSESSEPSSNSPYLYAAPSVYTTPVFPPEKVPVSVEHSHIRIPQSSQPNLLSDENVQKDVENTAVFSPVLKNAIHHAKLRGPNNQSSLLQTTSQQPIQISYGAPITSIQHTPNSTGATYASSVQTLATSIADGVNYSPISTATSLTAAVKTPLPTPLLNSLIQHQVTEKSVPIVPKSPANAFIANSLLSNSYRANLPTQNGVRMNGFVGLPQVVDPTKPRLGRPPKSAKPLFGVVPSGRIAGTNMVQRNIRPKLSTIRKTNNAGTAKSLNSNLAFQAHMQQASNSVVMSQNVNYPTSSIATSQVNNETQERAANKLPVTEINSLKSIAKLMNHKIDKSILPSAGLKNMYTKNKESKITSTKADLIENRGLLNGETPKSKIKAAETLINPQIPKLLEIAETLKQKADVQRSLQIAANPVTSTYSSTFSTPTLSQQLNAFIDPSLYAAYMADYATVHNLLSLSQAAARINLAANGAPTVPKEDSIEALPMDLSPTNKNISSPSTSQSKPAKKVTPAFSRDLKPPPTGLKPPPTSKAVSLTPKTQNGMCIGDALMKYVESGFSKPPTLSSPTMEVTITKLHNTVTTSAETSATSSAATTLKPSSTNTISITKKPLPGKLTKTSIFNGTTRSPSNASVRQIPNPSLLSHSSESRNHVKSLKATQTIPPLVSPSLANNNNNCNNNLNNTVKVNQ